MLFQKLSESYEKRSGILVIVFGILFFVFQYHLHFNLNWSYISGGEAGLFLAVISILFIATLSMWLSKFKFKLLLYVGSSSMTIYLLHILAGSGARIALKKY